MSPRAACRLATIGFTEVYDYVAGKADWLARGLPREGAQAAEPRAIDFVRDDAVLCGLTDRVGDVRARVAASPYRFAFVVSDGRVLLGRLRRVALDADPQLTAEEAMEPGPSTIRADTPPAELRERLRRGDLRTAVVTTPDGVLLGVVRRQDLEHDDDSRPPAT